MSSRSTRQFDKRHAVTVVAAADIAPYRFVSYGGQPAAAAPDKPLKESQGISETGAKAGEALSVVTGYSYTVEAAEAIEHGAYVKPAADGSGKAAAGTASDHCGRALCAAARAGELIEVQLLHHVHA